MKKLIQMIPVGIMIVPMSLNAQQDTKSIIGLMFLIVSLAIFLPILYALVESIYSTFIRRFLKNQEKVVVL